MNVTWPPQINEHYLRNLVPADANTGFQIGRVFIVHTTNPRQLPQQFDPKMQFDRIVYVTDGVPTSIDPVLVPLLKMMAGQVPYFTSYVPSVLVSGTAAESDAAGFGVRHMPDYADTSAPAALTEAHLFRDACVLSLDLLDISAKFPPWDTAGRPTAFVQEVSAANQKRARRWGRAVTNLRVGVALSGGGASAYRAAALFRGLATARVPVDVVAGLSGGAVVGAYFCQGGAEGLARATRHGPLFQAVLPWVLLSSWPVEFLVNLDLRGAQLGELDVRFAPVTTELPSVGAPASAVVSRGSIGEGVRASGCLPPAFAPMKRNGNRYTDGGAAAVVPAEFLRDCGADLTIACNVIPGGDRTNPLDAIPVVGTLLHDWTPIGRLIDIWAWYTFMWAQASRQFGEVADVFIEFLPQRISFLECFLWVCAEDIAKRAAGEQRLAEGLQNAQKQWAQLQNPPPPPPSPPPSP